MNLPAFRVANVSVTPTKLHFFIFLVVLRPFETLHKNANKKGKENQALLQKKINFDVIHVT